jgi:thiol:disulfide interchange protein DsbA
MVRQAICVAVAAILVLCAGSVAAEVVQGKDYVLLDGATEAGRAIAPSAHPGIDRIEVVEFFSYACPHCARLEPQLEKWRHALPANVVLRRVPVVFGRNEWEVLARLYFTLEAGNQLDALHGKVFAALHQQHASLFTPDAAADWVARQGVDRRTFLDGYNSFAVQLRLQGANALAQQAGIDSVPSFVVGGRYRTDLDMARDYARLLNIVDALIARSAGAGPVKPRKQ